MQFGVEPEWPPCPPPSLASSPFTAYCPGTAESALLAESTLPAEAAEACSLGWDAVPRKLELQEPETG